MINAIREQIICAGLGNLKGCSNAGLALDRYLPAQDDVEERKKLVEAASKIRASEIYLLAYHRWQDSLSRMQVAFCECKVQDRLIVGLGSESVLEAGITLNRIYGVPVIPGSALKGLARHYYESVVGRAGDEHAKVLFGDQVNAGYITFYDAWYVPGTAAGDCPLQNDVMTPHHQKYYSSEGKTPPTDFDDPNPVGFLSAVGSYLIAVKGPNKEWSEFALELLKKALADAGAGGKTSSGYGRMLASQARLGETASTESVLQSQILALTPGKVRPEIGSFYPKWQALEGGDEKAAVARAIVQKLEQCGALKDKKWAEKEWVVDVLRYLEQHA